MTCEYTREVLERCTALLAGMAESLHDLHRKADHIMSQQADLDQDFTELSTALGDVATQTTNATAITAEIQAEIASLQAAQPQLDLSKLDALATSAASTTAALDSSVSGLAALVPAAPATAAEPTA